MKFFLKKKVLETKFKLIAIKLELDLKIVAEEINLYLTRLFQLSILVFIMF